MPSTALPATRLLLLPPPTVAQDGTYTRTVPLTGALTAATTLLYDRFDTNAAAPLGSPRTAEPGPGSWTVTDASSIISIASNRLTVSGTPGAVSGLAAAASVTRTAGRALFLTLPTFTFNANPRLGWHTSGTISAGPQYGLDGGGGGSNWRVKTGTSATVNQPVAVGTAPYEWCIVMRGTGAYALYRATGGGGGAWTLAYVWRTSSAALFANLAANTSVASTFTADDVYILDLGDTSGANFNSDDYALASSRSATSTGGEQKTMAAADSIVEHTITASGTQSLWVRWNEATGNGYRLDLVAGTPGSYQLVRVDGGVDSAALASGTPTISGSFRVVVSCRGNNIRAAFNDGGESVGYTSASLYTTQTGAKVSNAGTDFICWAQTVTLSPPSP